MFGFRRKIQDTPKNRWTVWYLKTTQVENACACMRIKRHVKSAYSCQNYYVTAHLLAVSNRTESVWHVVSNTVKQCMNIKCCHKLRKTATKSHATLVQMYVLETVNSKCVLWLIEKFPRRKGNLIISLVRIGRQQGKPPDNIGGSGATRLLFVSPLEDSHVTIQMLNNVWYRCFKRTSERRPRWDFPAALQTLSKVCCG